MLGVLIFDTLPGLVIGIVVSLLLLLYRASKPYFAELGRVDTDGVAQYADRSRHPENRGVPGVPVLRVESGLFFANPEAVRSAIKARAAERMLDELADDLERAGQQLVTAHDLGQVGDLLSAHPQTSLAVFATIDEAIAAVDS